MNGMSWKTSELFVAKCNDLVIFHHLNCVIYMKFGLETVPNYVFKNY